MAEQGIKTFKKLFIEKNKRLSIRQIKDGHLEERYSIKTNAIVGFIRRATNESRIMIAVVDFNPNSAILATYLHILFHIFQEELSPMNINLKILETVAAFKRQAWIDNHNGKVVIELQIPIKKNDAPIQKVLYDIIMNTMDKFHLLSKELSALEKGIERL